MNSSEKIVPGGIYQHYKGKNYRLIDLVRHSETLEELVLYEALYENSLGKFWVRPKNIFFQDVEPGISRFRFVQNE